MARLRELGYVEHLKEVRANTSTCRTRAARWPCTAAPPTTPTLAVWRSAWEWNTCACVALTECACVALTQYIQAGKPFFGICLGMQTLFEGSDETPGVEGLGILPGNVARFDVTATHNLAVPQIGWNGVNVRSGSRSSDGQRPRARGVCVCVCVCVCAPFARARALSLSLVSVRIRVRIRVYAVAFSLALHGHW